MISKSRVKFFLVLLTSLLVLGCVEDDASILEAGPDGEVPEASLASQAGPRDSGDTSLDTKALFPLVDRWQLPQVGQEVFNLEQTADDSECCTAVGQADECWMEDATDDGIICPTWGGAPSGYSLACLYGSCNADGTLCACEDDGDCWDGTDRLGSCVVQPGDTVGQCGPSWCNGYKICSCWGGCVMASPVMPATTCDNADFDCCEGNYPQDPVFNTGGYVGNGYCADDPSCGGGCNSDADCNDSNVCTVDTCVIATGECTYSDDPSIDDSNVCTNDFCDPVFGITHVNNNDPCNADSDGCTIDDICSGGICVAGPAPDCGDGNICTDDACASTGVNTYSCNNTPNTDPCDDSNFCTTGDVCSGGACTYTGTLTCNDGEPCTDDDCDPSSGCVTAPNSDPCDDGDACTTGDICSGSSCTSTGTLSCNDFNICTTDSCNSATGCVFAFNTLPCNDSNACTSGDVCSMGSCGGTAITCNDANSCTNDSCSPATGCVFTPNTAPCSDGNACTTGDICSGGSCTPTGTLSCNDSNGCTNDTCNTATGCVYTPNTAPCSDGNACTTGDICSGGSCTSTGTLTCNDSNLCTDDTCDTSTGCVYTDNSDPCNDGNACTTGDYCSGGSCSAYAGTLTCNDSNICTNDSCNPATGCVFTNNSAPCSDSNACTTGDICSGGSCVGSAVTCNDSDPCTSDTCNTTSGCVYSAIPNCCEVDSECTSFCPAGYSTQCATPQCISNSCTCTLETAGTECTDFNTTTYPLNCYTGFCGEVDDPFVWYPTFGANDGLCQPVEHPAYNNLCSDLFSTTDFSDPVPATNINEGHDGYMGRFDNDGTVTAGPLASTGTGQLFMTGSTRCAFNNYQASGDDCNEWSIANDPIGIDGLDLVYVFEYETNSASQFDLYSYLVKVEGNFDLGMYVMTEVDAAVDCPEGNNPTLDDSDANPGYFWNSDSSRCSFPYSAAPTVVEDYCDPTGNDSQSPPQTCCDPCASSSCYTSGYYWCERGYPDGCNMCTTGCTGIWEYPEDPFNCDPETSYPVANMASSVIFPEGDTDGSIRRVFIYIDGVNADVGEFQISIERRKWFASPCDRVNDDARVFDVTHPGASGQTYLGSLEDVVNSMHYGSGSCGGYTCANWWAGDTSCHDGSSPNQFWPNTEHFKVHRQTGEGSATYCIQSDEAIADPADLVIEVHQRTYSSATTICDETYSDFGCEHDNLGSNTRYTFTAQEDELYLIGVSQYDGMTRPCLPSLGDDCNYKISIYEGPCPVVCSGPFETLAGGDVNITAANWNTYTVVNRTGNLTSADGDHYYINSSDYQDEVFRMYNTSGNSVDITISLCGTSGTGDPMIGLYQCDGSTLLAAKDVNGGGGACETLTYTLAPSTDPYYITADSYGTTNINNYTLSVTWGTPPCAPVLGQTAGDISLGSLSSPYDVFDSITTGNSDDYAEAWSNSRDEVWIVRNTTGSSKTLHIQYYGAITGDQIDSFIGFYSCNNSYLKSYDSGGCASNDQDSITIAAGEVLYIIADTYPSGTCGSTGDYQMRFTWW